MKKETLVDNAHLIDWQSIENLNDILSEQEEASVCFQNGLNYLLSQLGHSQAVLLIQGEGDDIPQLRVFSNIPVELQNKFDDPRSSLSHISQQVIHTGLFYPGDPSLGLAGAFPLEYHKEKVGGLFVIGHEINDKDLETWSKYTRPLARSIWSWKQAHKNSTIENDIRLLETLLSIQKETPQDVNIIQHTTINHARDLYHAQDALLVLFDDGGSSLVFHKQLDIRGQWVERRSMIPDDSHYLDALRNAMNEAGIIPATSEFYRWLNLVSETVVNNAICAPLRSKNKLIGGLILINPGRSSDEVPPFLFELLTTFLSNAIEVSRELTTLKISIADLEANRWEIINSRNTLLTFFDSIPVSVYIVDRNFTLISINLHRSGRLNKHPNILVGKKCYEQLFNRIDPCPACRVMETLRNGAVTTRISREWMDQDRFVEWEITTFPIQESDHLPHRVIVFEEDVTEKRNLEANLIQSEKLASVGQLAAGVAHEINNPLAAIIANAQLLKRELPKDDEDGVYSSVELIEMAGMRAAQVVSNLLSLARKEKKDEFELISLNESILNALTLVNHEVKNHSIDIRLDLEENIPEIMASKNHLQGVWINMIVNGIDSIDDNNGQISIATRYLNNEFRVVIADNGKGIPQDHLSRIFEPFFTTKVAGKGTGLGLSVCYRVIKEHQGNIQVESQAGIGTKFTIILPNLVRRNL